MCKVCFTLFLVNKTLLPEAVSPGRPYPFLADVKLNLWALVALLTTLLARWWLAQHPDWSVFLRSAIALSPLAPSLFYVRGLARWIRGMDEMQRRMQLEASLFATTATVFVATAISLLGTQGIHLPRLHDGLGWEGTFAVALGFQFLGNLLVNRQYR